MAVIECSESGSYWVFGEWQLLGVRRVAVIERVRSVAVIDCSECGSY